MVTNQLDGAVLFMNYDVQAMMQNILVDEGEQALGLEFEADASVTELVIIRVNDAATGTQLVGSCTTFLRVVVGLRS
jgi:hypothetical protein